MRDAHELARNFRAFISGESAPTLLTLLDLVGEEMRARALPGSVDLASAAHKLSLYVSAYRAAHGYPPINSADCSQR